MRGNRHAAPTIGRGMLNTQVQTEDHDAEILRYEVSTDGVNWRPFNPTLDPADSRLHRRIEFAPPADEL